MRKKSALIPALVALLVFSVLAPAASAAAPAKMALSFNKDVAPIVFKNCTGCHHPGDVAPFSLMSYQTARPWAKSIREKVVMRTMPPWHADSHYGRFSNDRRLSQQDVDTIVSWVDGGALEGDAKDLPPAPVYPDGWSLGKPDLVFSIPEEFDVPAQGVVEYQHFVVPTNFTEDRWVQAAEIRPGNRAVVHHVIVWIQEPGNTNRQPVGVQVLRPDQAVPPLQQPGQGRPRAPRWNGMLAGSGAGEQATFFRPGTARVVPKGSNLVFQVHYTPNGKSAKDRTSVGLIFAKEQPQFPIRTVGVMNGRFVIPAGEANFKVESAAVFTEDAQIWGVFPHMHLRGKSFEYRLIYLDGRSEIILSVPKYDFNWQNGYSFAKPLQVPKGTRLECTAYFDNSSKNAFNPDPTKEVRWGDQTWEEMMIGWTSYTVESQKVKTAAGGGGSQ